MRSLIINTNIDLFYQSFNLEIILFNNVFGFINEIFSNRIL